MTTRPSCAPVSIHDPITAEQAQYLPAFYWNVQPDKPKKAKRRYKYRNRGIGAARVAPPVLHGSAAGNGGVPQDQRAA